MDIRKTETGRIWVDDEGIVRFVATGARSTADTSAENLAALRELTGGKQAPILFDVRAWPPAHPSFWHQFIDTVATMCVAGAVIVDGPALDRLGEFPQLIDKLLVPFHVTSDEADALAFLRNSPSVDQSESS